MTPETRAPDERTKRLAEAPVGRLLWTFSLPAIAGMVVSSLYMAIDRAFLGNAVGPDAIAGLTLCAPIAFVIMAVGMLIGIGSGSLVSIRLGEGKKDEAERILGNAVALVLVAGVGLSAIFLTFLEPLLALFGATERTLPYASQFMRVILWGAFFQYASFGLNAIIRAEGNPRLAMATQLINAGLNVVLDAVFILWFEWGVTGAAVATVIAQGASATWTLAHFRSRRSVLKLRLQNLRPSWPVLRPALALGLAPFSMHLAGSVTSVLLNRGLSQHGGEAAISAFGIISVLSMLMWMPIIGINQGAQPIMGFNYGAKNLDRVLRTLKLALLAAVALLVPAFVLVQAAPHLLIRIFSPDESLIAVGMRGMRLCLAMLPVVGVQIIGANFFQAIGKAKVALVLSLLRQVLLLIPLVVVLPSFLGLDGLWLAPAISDGVATLITSVVLALQLRTLRAGTASQRIAAAA